MKITDFIIIFIVISLPTYFFLEAKAENTETFIQLNNQNKGALTVAAQDAIHSLRIDVNPNQESNYASYKVNPVDPQPALETFLQTLAINYRVEDRITADVMSRYVPVFAVVDYDGLLLNVYKEYKDTENMARLERMWLPKIPFSFSDNEGNIVNFTVGEDIEVYDIDRNEWYSGNRAELVSKRELDYSVLDSITNAPTVTNEPTITIPLLEDEELFQNVRRMTIVDTLQENIAYYINEHNVYRKELDVTYKFALPYIPEEDWYNTIDDISILAFFQGYPYRMADETYHEYAFVGTRLHKNDVIKAGIVNGKRYFWYDSCNYPYLADEIYSTKQDAVSHGYSELSCLNP